MDPASRSRPPPSPPRPPTRGRAERTLPGGHARGRRTRRWTAGSGRVISRTICRKPRGGCQFRSQPTSSRSSNWVGSRFTLTGRAAYSRLFVRHGPATPAQTWQPAMRKDRTRGHPRRDVPLPPGPVERRSRAEVLADRVDVACSPGGDRDRVPGHARGRGAARSHLRSLARQAGVVAHGPSRAVDQRAVG
jgi:hypothetical protein